MTALQIIVTLIGCCATAEISTEFFMYIAMLQSRGVTVIFKH